MHSQELGDYIGVESCIDLSPDIPDIVSRGGAKASHTRRSRRSDAAEYPPPIQLLSQSHTENLPSHVPWVMKRYRTSDGRLVITEERHEYFRVSRSNGRLVLNLIPVDVGRDGEREKLGCLGVEMDKRTGDPPPEGVYIGVEPCGGFGVAMAGLMPPVHS